MGKGYPSSRYILLLYGLRYILKHFQYDILPIIFFMPFVVKSITLFWKILWIKLYSSDDWEKKQKPKFHMKRTIRYHQNMMYKMFKIQLLNMEVSSESNPMCLISKYELCLQSIWRQQKSDSNRSKDRAQEELRRKSK